MTPDITTPAVPAQTMTLTLPDGNQKTLPAGATGLSLAEAISPRLAKAAIAVRLNGSHVQDLRQPLRHGDTIEILTRDHADALEVLRHSTAHVMAQAVQHLFPGTRIAIGPTIDHGFYYDFEIPGHQLTPEDLPRIEAEMARIAAQKQRFERREIADIPAQVAQFRQEGEVYKAELLEGIAAHLETGGCRHEAHGPGAETATVYYCVHPETQQDVWHDLCRGPHLPDTGYLGAYKLLSVAGAYWRGDERNPMLQRIYAAAFWTQKDLDAFLQQREEAEKRDHRRLGKQLELFSIEDTVGSGLILWHPNLAVVREQLEAFWRREHRRRGYDMVYTPHLAKRDLWEISGHTAFYLENMFTMDIDGQDYILKPMNCPLHVLIFKSKIRSYRELPLRIAELGTVYRYEKSGTMHGLTRVRGFTQDDAHLFCRPDQISSEIQQVIALVDQTLGLFDMTFDVALSTRPEKFVGDPAIWDAAEAALHEALAAAGVAYSVNAGDGAFYGPKIDFKLKDAIGRTWQCSTVQLDFNLPERFGLHFTDSDGVQKRPIMIHRAIFGSLERFAGTLIEHFAGSFPTWLAPVQVAVLPIADRHLNHADAVAQQLMDAEVRVRVDRAQEGIGAKIRNAQLAKVPYMLIVGDKEQEAGAVAVRARQQGDLGAMAVPAFVDALLQEIRTYGKSPLRPAT
jgi:threonyl-tRNA synthetase